MRLAQLRFRLGQFVGGTLTARLGLADRIGKLFAFGGDFFRCGGRFVEFFFAFGFAIGQLARTPFRRFQAVTPAAHLFGNFLAAAQAGLALAAHLVEHRPLGHHGDARGLDRHFDVFNAGARIGQVRQIRQRFFRSTQFGPQAHRLFFVAAQRQCRVFALALSKVAVRLGTAQRTVGVSDLLIRCAACVASGLICHRQIR